MICKKNGIKSTPENDIESAEIGKPRGKKLGNPSAKTYSAWITRPARMVKSLEPPVCNNVFRLDHPPRPHGKKLGTPTCKKRNVFSLGRPPRPRGKKLGTPRPPRQAVSGLDRSCQPVVESLEPRGVDSLATPSWLQGKKLGQRWRYSAWKTGPLVKNDTCVFTSTERPQALAGWNNNRAPPAPSHPATHRTEEL